jgi:hypothetical protein
MISMLRTTLRIGDSFRSLLFLARAPLNHHEPSMFLFLCCWAWNFLYVGIIGAARGGGETENCWLELVR